MKANRKYALNQNMVCCCGCMFMHMSMTDLCVPTYLDS